MSSVIGHALTGAVVFFQANHRPKAELLWLAWLLVVASFPDIEYGLLWLFGKNLPLRITHSMVFCTLLPMLTLIAARWLVPNPQWKSLTLQTCLAGYSHLVLDILVGVSPLPLLWPFSTYLFKLPFGILPSAGRPALKNVYLYLNLLIELGILLPLYVMLLWKPSLKDRKQRWWVIGLGVIFVCFVCVGISLKR
jgi:inner membrane protein